MAVAKTSRPSSGGLDLLKVELNRKELLTKVSSVLPACEVGKTGLPILKSICLKIKDGVLELVATDLNMLLRTTLPVSVIGEAALCVPGKLFSELLAKLSEAAVTLVFQHEGLRVEVPGAKSKMAALPAENFPTFEEHQGGWCKLSNAKGALAQMMRLALKGATTDESRFTLAGAQFEIEPQAQRLISTNGHRLFYVEQQVPCDTQAVRSCLLPIKALKEFGKLTAETWEFALSDNHVFVRAGEVELRCRLNTGQFPNYQNVLPKHTNVLKLEAGLFVQIARRMLNICDGDEGGVKLEARANTLHFSTHNQEGWSATDSLPVEQVGGDLLTKLAAKYLLGLFEEAGDCTALLRYADGKQVVEMNLASEKEARPVGAADDPPPRMAEGCERLSERPEPERARASSVSSLPAAPSRQPRMGQRAVAYLVACSFNLRRSFSFSSNRKRYFILSVSRSANRVKISLSRTRISIS